MRGNKGGQKREVYRGSRKALNRLPLAYRYYLLMAACCLSLSLPNEAATQQRRRPVTIPGEIRGQVRVAGSEAVIQGVMVRLEVDGGGIVEQTSTDGLGQFRFSNLNQAIYYIVVHTPGYHDARQRVDLTTSPRSYVLLHLTEIPNEEGTAAASGAAAVPVRVYQIPAQALKEIEKAQADLLEKKNIASGIGHLKKAITLYPSSPEVYLLLGTAYMDVNNLPEAKKALTRAIELDEKMAAAYFALGECYNQERNYSEAEDVLLKGLALDEKAWQGHLALGKTYWAIGDVSRAAPHATRAHELNPHFPQVHLLMGNVYLRNRDAQRALSEFEDYLKQDPEGPFAQQTRTLVERIRQALASPNK